MTVVFLLIMALCFSGRKAQVSHAVAPPTGPPLQTARAGAWSLDLIRLDECPARKIVVAVVRVHGPALSSSDSPVAEVTAPGLEFDGGAWTDFATTPIVVSYAGACGSPEQCPILTGEGLLVLRFRGRPAARPLPLHFNFSGIPVKFQSATVSRARSSVPGLVGTIFGR